MKQFSGLSLIAVLAALLGCGGCGESAPTGTLVLTQTPIGPAGTIGATDILDVRYPAGSRVVLALPPFQPGSVRVLSKGLVSAGSPIVSPDGRHVFFAGKAGAAAAWQIYEARPGGGTPKQITDIPGGAMDPALIATGDLVFSSPVPKAGGRWKRGHPSALYAQSPGGSPRRLTFGSASAVEPTVLADGRILFVSAQPAATNGAEPHLALFTVNNDGTEVTAFAGQHDGAASIHRPRELGHGRVGFLASNPGSAASDCWAESVRTARPFTSRGRLFQFQAGRCRSVEPGAEGALLASFESHGVMGRSMRGSQAVFQFSPEAQALGQPLFDDPSWDDIEAARLAPRPKPTGHISTMVAAKKTGTILCLDANRTSSRSADGGQPPVAARVRVLSETESGALRALGEVALQSDGSFLAEVPADVPLGFEALDAHGNVLRRLPPMLWVRAGENRSCLGCHEPHNRSPRNIRPLAVNLPPVRLGAPLATVAMQSPRP